MNKLSYRQHQVLKSTIADYSNKSCGFPNIVNRQIKYSRLINLFYGTFSLSTLLSSLCNFIAALVISNPIAGIKTPNP